MEAATNQEPTRIRVRQLRRGLVQQLRGPQRVLMLTRGRAVMLIACLDALLEGGVEEVMGGDVPRQAPEVRA